MDGLFRRKSIDRVTEHRAGERLVPTLGWPHLIALGIGAIVGTGIYTLIGVGASLAGPAVILSFALAGLVCAGAALAYAEMSTMMPAAGSAYTYSYVALGEVIAWIVGVSLILEYSMVVSTVAVGWSGYAVGFLKGLGVALPQAMVAGPLDGGVVNLPAVFITFVVAGLLMLGTKESATLNAVLVAVKIAALVLFVVIALPHFDAARFDPFMPFGFAKHEIVQGDGKILERGVMAAASIIFFAFYGFDAISTAAEETKRPERDLAIGIVGSMVACTIIYMVIAAVAVGALSYTVFGSSPEPLALILRSIGQGKAAGVIAAAAVVALPTVLLAFLYGQSRIFFVMGRDGLLPRALAKVSARTGTPIATTLFTAVIIAVFAGLVPLGDIAALANAGTLCAFIAVSLCMLVLRRREPERRRMFRVPAAWVVGPAAILGCVYLFYNLPHRTQAFFFIANGIGLLLYFAYGRRHAMLGREG